MSERNELTPDQKRQRRLLWVLGALLLFLAYRQVGGLFDRGGDGFLGGSRRADFSAMLETPVERLAFDRLQAEAQETTIGRSPWEYGRPPAPPPPPPREPVQAPPPQPRVVENPEPVVTAPPKPVPPPVDVEFLGWFGPEQGRIAVFGRQAGQDELVINARVGDVIEEKFEVHSIGLESVDLIFPGFPDAPPKRLPLKKRG